MFYNYPIYCLHIVQYKNRLDNINNLKKQFSFFKNITICNFAKTNINNIIAYRFIELHTTYYNKFNNDKNIYGNVFSCAYNWLQIIKCAYENGDEYAFFMEDDLNFKAHISNEYIDNLIKAIPTDADVVKICTSNYPITSPNIKDRNNFFNKIVLQDMSEQWKVDSNNSFFMLSRKAMKFYIDSQESNFGISDFNINYDTHNLNVYMHKNYRYFIKYKYESTINNA